MKGENTQGSMEERKEGRGEGGGEGRENERRLVDIGQIVIQKEGSKEEKIADFIHQTGDPYICRCGDLVVQSVFVDPDTTLTERLSQYVRMVL